MQLSPHIYFYKGDTDIHKKSAFQLYRGIGSSNFLVIKDGDQLMLDSGFHHGPHRRRLNQEMKADGVDLGDTKTVLFSHSHPDHIQNANRIARHQAIKFAMHQDSEPFVRSEGFHFAAYYNYPDSMKQEIMILPPLLARLTFALLGFGFGHMQVHEYFHHGSVYKYCDGIYVVEIPGHCMGHAGFYIPSQGIFYAADLTFDSKTEFGILPCLNNALSNCSHALDDLDRVTFLDITRYIPGHGNIIDGRSAVRQHLAAASGNMRRLLDATLFQVRSGLSLTLTQITRRLFGPMALGNFIHLAPVVYQTLKYLAAQDLIVCAEIRSRMLWQPH